MRIDWLTLGLQTVNALVLIWLLARFLFQPVADIIARRQAEAARLLDDAEDAKAGAAALREQADEALAEIAAGRAEALAAAGTLAQHEKEALLAGARAEIDKLRETESAALLRERHAERRAARARASELAVEISKRLMARLPREAQILGFIDGLAQAVAASPRSAPAPLRLVAPRPLEPAEEAACRRALTQALGRAPDLTIEADPSLVAGLELESQHVSVRNSFRADLARIADELKGQDGDDA